jgi:Methyltransferase domain
MNLQDLLDDPPGVHPCDGQLIAWGLPRATLDFIDVHVIPGSKTLETGSGLSTILFALKGAHHICITPFQEEVDRIRDYCTRRSVSLQNVDFRVDLSTSILPNLGSAELDLALIDGCHGFPTPFMDWYFMATALKLGGILIVDDVQIWTGRVLKDFLVSEPEWELVEPFSDKTAIFVKEHYYHPWKDFAQQPYVVQQDRVLDHEESTLRKGLRLLRQGQIVELLRKVAHRFTGGYAVGPETKEGLPAVLPPGIETNSAEAVPRIARRAAEQAVRTKAASAGSGSDQSHPR